MLSSTLLAASELDSGDVGMSSSLGGERETGVIVPFVIIDLELNETMERRLLCPEEEAQVLLLLISLGEPR